LAKKLKEKGYTLDTAHHYNDNGDIVVSLVEFDERCVYPCPEIHQVLKWLREGKAISVEPYASASGWRVTICRAYHQDRCDAGGGTCLKREVIGYNDGGAFEEYEEAVIAGIECCLDNLI
jgi:hypothetical protein